MVGWMTRPLALDEQITALTDALKRARDEGAIEVEIDVTRGGTVRCKAVFSESARRPEFKTGR